MRPKHCPEPAARILFLTSVAKDAELTAGILERASMPCHRCIDIQDVVLELAQGASALLMPEELVQGNAYDQLSRWLRCQPPWSDFPILILARPGADSARVAQAMDMLGNVTVLERPMRISALVSAVQSAVRARERQYQIRDHLKAREAAETKLRSDDRRKDEFLAILAHELRNPLAPIRHALDVLRLNDGLDPEASHLRGLIERQVDHMVRLVDDLLEVSRITRGKVELRRVEVEISSIVDGALEASRPLINQRCHELEVSLPDDRVSLFGDPVRLTQVLSNLLNNAAKYTDPGGKITLTVSSNGDSMELVVTDSGTGISSEMLPRVFDMFAQSDRSVERSQGGLGIGLTLVKSLVEMHGGSVEAYSDGPGKGSKFAVQLPCAPVSEGSPAKSASAASHPTGHRLLVVDDNRDAANTLGTLLDLLGADVKTVYSGEEALDTIGKFHPTAVLLDIGMPTLSGHEVAKKIRAAPEFDDITLIALTGWGQEGDRRLSEEAGFNHHLVKPIDIRVLEGLLGTLSAGHA